ncbi:MAG: hypothetical protein RL463_376 [Bacteroidota bacterium]|jgi:hypothetical protein
MNLKTAIHHILSLEPSLELKLNLLTEIGLHCVSDELFNATEEVRGELVCQTEIQEVGEINLRSNEQQ